MTESNHVSAEVKLRVNVRDAEQQLQPKKLSSFAKPVHVRAVSEHCEQEKNQQTEARVRSESINDSQIL